jgi:hypothetical protein
MDELEARIELSLAVFPEPSALFGVRPGKSILSPGFAVC